MKIKKAVLLIHGFAGGNYDYGELSNDLQMFDDFDVFTFTLPGHDQLIITDVTKEDWTKKAEEQLNKIITNDYKEICVIGHSMGGVIAVYLASKYKEVTKLVLAAPAFKYFKFKNNKINLSDSIKLLPKIFKRYKIKETLSRIFKVPLKTVKEFAGLVERHTNDIKNVTCPTLILWGNKDDIVPKDSINLVYNNLKSTSITMIEINNVSHNLFVNERYEEIKNLIINFLKKKDEKIKEKNKI